jgi:UDP-N-acetyl-D-mannosaminuronate dehydrogenase
VSTTILVVGLGEIGRPLLELVRAKHAVTGVDLQPVDIECGCSIMHVCFPFSSSGFVDECERYIRKYRPELTIINSTVAPFTTRRIQERTGSRVVNSPVRGKHFNMKQELLHYTKFIGGSDPAACREAEAHFCSLGMKTRVLSSPEATEVAKLTETTYFGVLIAWAQEVERYCDQFALDYDEVVAFYEEIAFLPPVKYTPGVIGGHCVMPNIEILRHILSSDLLDAIRKSNDLKSTREATSQRPPKSSGAPAELLDKAKASRRP